MIAPFQFEISLPAGELDLDASLSSGQLFRFRFEAAGWWVGADGDAWYSFRQSSCVAGDVCWEVSSSHGPDRAAHMLGLDRSWLELAQGLSRLDSRWPAVLARRPGLRLLRSSDLIECLFCFLCSANNNLPRIVSMIAKLAALGEPMGPEELRLRRFPDPARIAAWGEASLRDAGFGYRAGPVCRVAERLAAEGPGLVEHWRALPYVDLRRELMELPGVGPKVADCVALYGFHRDEAVPIDTHLWNAITRWHFPEWSRHAPTVRRYEEAGALFRRMYGRWAGWAQLLLYFDTMRTPRRAK